MGSHTGSSIPKIPIGQIVDPSDFTLFGSEIDDYSSVKNNPGVQEKSDRRDSRLSVDKNQGLKNFSSKPVEKIYTAPFTEPQTIRGNEKGKQSKAESKNSVPADNAASRATPICDRLFPKPSTSTGKQTNQAISTKPLPTPTLLDNVAKSTQAVIKCNSCTLHPPKPGRYHPASKDRPPGCKTIWVGGFPKSATETVIREIFGWFGNIVDLRMEQVFCHIQFEQAMAVNLAVSLSGYRIVVGDSKDSVDSGLLFVDYVEDVQETSKKSPAKVDGMLLSNADNEAKKKKSELKEKETLIEDDACSRAQTEISDLKTKYETELACKSREIERLTTALESRQMLLKNSKILRYEKDKRLAHFEANHKNCDRSRRDNDILQKQLKACQDELRVEKLRVSALEQETSQLKLWLSDADYNGKQLHEQISINETEHGHTLAALEKKLRDRELALEAAERRLREIESNQPAEVSRLTRLRTEDRERIKMLEKELADKMADDRLKATDVRLISLISAFLLIHPRGAEFDCIAEYVERMEPATSSDDVQSLLGRCSAVFGQHGSKWVLDVHSRTEPGDKGAGKSSGDAGTENAAENSPRIKTAPSKTRSEQPDGINSHLSGEVAGIQPLSSKVETSVETSHPSVLTSRTQPPESQIGQPAETNSRSSTLASQKQSTTSHIEKPIGTDTHSSVLASRVQPTTSQTGQPVGTDSLSSGLAAQIQSTTSKVGKPVGTSSRPPGPASQIQTPCFSDVQTEQKNTASDGEIELKPNGLSSDMEETRLANVLKKFPDSSAWSPQLLRRLQEISVFKNKLGLFFKASRRHNVRVIVPMVSDAEREIYKDTVTIPAKYPEEDRILCHDHPEADAKTELYHPCTNQTKDLQYSLAPKSKRAAQKAREITPSNASESPKDVPSSSPSQNRSPNPGNKIAEMTASGSSYSEIKEENRLARIVSHFPNYGDWSFGLRKRLRHYKALGGSSPRAPNQKNEYFLRLRDGTKVRVYLPKISMKKMDRLNSCVIPNKFAEEFTLEKNDRTGELRTATDLPDTKPRIPKRHHETPSLFVRLESIRSPKELKAEQPSGRDESPNPHVRSEGIGSPKEAKTEEQLGRCETSDPHISLESINSPEAIFEQLLDHDEPPGPPVSLESKRSPKETTNEQPSGHQEPPNASISSETSTPSVLKTTEENSIALHLPELHKSKNPEEAPTRPHEEVRFLKPQIPYRKPPVLVIGHQSVKKRRCVEDPQEPPTKVKKMGQHDSKNCSGRDAKDSGCQNKAKTAAKEATENLDREENTDKGVETKSSGTVGKSDGAVGKSDGAVGKSDGAVGKSDGAVGKSDGAARDAGVGPQDAPTFQSAEDKKQSSKSSKRSQPSHEIRSSDTGPEGRSWRRDDGKKSHRSSKESKKRRHESSVSRSSIEAESINREPGKYPSDPNRGPRKVDKAHDGDVRDVTKKHSNKKSKDIERRLHKPPKNCSVSVHPEGSNKDGATKELDKANVSTDSSRIVPKHSEKKGNLTADAEAKAASAASSVRESSEGSRLEKNDSEKPKMEKPKSTVGMGEKFRKLFDSSEESLTVNSRENCPILDITEPKNGSRDLAEKSSVDDREKQKRSALEEPRAREKIFGDSTNVCKPAEENLFQGVESACWSSNSASQQTRKTSENEDGDSSIEDRDRLEKTFDQKFQDFKKKYKGFVKVKPISALKEHVTKVGPIKKQSESPTIVNFDEFLGVKPPKASGNEILTENYGHDRNQMSSEKSRKECSGREDTDPTEPGTSSGKTPTTVGNWEGAMKTLDWVPKKRSKRFKPPQNSQHEETRPKTPDSLAKERSELLEPTQSSQPRKKICRKEPLKTQFPKIRITNPENVIRAFAKPNSSKPKKKASLGSSKKSADAEGSSKETNSDTRKASVDKTTSHSTNGGRNEGLGFLQVDQQTDDGPSLQNAEELRDPARSVQGIDGSAESALRVGDNENGPTTKMEVEFDDPETDVKEEPESQITIDELKLEIDEKVVEKVLAVEDCEKTFEALGREAQDIRNELQELFKSTEKPPELEDAEAPAALADASNDFYCDTHWSSEDLLKISEDEPERDD